MRILPLALIVIGSLGVLMIFGRMREKTVFQTR